MLKFVRFLRMLALVFVGVLGAFQIAPAAACTVDEITLTDGTCVEAKFSVNITSGKNGRLTFYINASGTFYVDWGDGSNVETVNNATVQRSQLGTHKYSTAGDYVLRIGGLATGYSSVVNSNGSTISFYSSGSTQSMVTGISGSLGALFPTIDGGTTAETQPHFNSMFRNCSNLAGTIPENLFQGISGPATESMFEYAFSGTKLSSYVPYNLFNGITGNPYHSMFYIFFNTTTLATTCPPNTTQVITGYENDWNINTSGTTKAIACKPDTPSCDHAYNGACPDLCSFGSALKTSTGLSFPLYATKVTTVAINIQQNGVTCYVPLEAGNGGSGSLNLTYNNTTYHAGVIDVN